MQFPNHLTSANVTHGRGKKFVMISSRKKVFVVALLLLTSLFQGWPLLVAAQCRMLAASTQACEMKSACCCEERESAETSAYAKCTSAKKLVGVLSTDPSLLPSKDKGKEPVFTSFIVAPEFEALALGASFFRFARSNASEIIPPSSSSPLFLIDCVFRI